MQNICKRKSIIWNWNLQNKKSFVAASNLLENDISQVMTSVTAMFMAVNIHMSRAMRKRD